MGQICGPGVLCDLVPGGERKSSDEATRKVDQLALELRMLKDENYRIREEQLRLEKELKARSSWHGSTGSTGRRSLAPAPGQSGRGREGRDEAERLGRFTSGNVGQGQANQAGPPGGKGCEDHQLMYMKEVIRSLQAENTRLRKGETSVSASPTGVTEEEYRRLEGQLRMLQRQHGRMQAAGSAGVSTAVSGVSTPLSSFGEDQRAMRALAGHYEALQREQQELRNKVRRLARG
ncbi:unnamed protein product [Cladocopium goreaui]|uniref:Ribulose-1,5 bisphosphate carboxylase/oxygenase large subunit N-methyltransferase, chloroplastic n=1 Tax=Cladocopium goreaui TaxID=2562237 RepID=A0A9P1GTV3_9DINO|nr:unnamed protein product [Cladocopium goreaui]